MTGQSVAIGQEAPDTTSAVPTAAVVPATDPLILQVEEAIAITSRRKLTAGVYTPWQVVHGILALRQDFIMKKPDGGEISGIEWMASGALHEGQTLFEVTPYGGRGRPFTKPYAFEGHPTQFMGYMAMCDLPLDFQFQAGEKKITVADIINDAKMQVREGPEITWTLWALSHYLEPNAEWINAAGESWSIERLVQIQTRESVVSGACGGTHGLFALAYARNHYLATGKPLQGVWIEADQKIKRFVSEAKALQNADGSFSAAYFRGPQYSTDFATRLPANGHILEWLMVALTDQQLNEQWVRNGVASVSKDLIDNRRAPTDCGPLYHALHGLKLYNYRVNPHATDFGKAAKTKSVTQKTEQPAAKPAAAVASPAPVAAVNASTPEAPVATPEEKPAAGQQ
jgi:hypothetical protein